MAQVAKLVKIPIAAQHPIFWLIAFVLWFATLWHLSSGPIPAPAGPNIPHLDKIAHFGYFFGGSGLLSAFFHTLGKGRMPLHVMLTCVLLILAAVGCLDEWHQSWIPERSGNDSMDLTADIIGAIVGFHTFRKFAHLFPSNSRIEK